MRACALCGTSTAMYARFAYSNRYGIWFTLIYRNAETLAVVSLCQSWSYPFCVELLCVLPLSLPCIYIIAWSLLFVNSLFCFSLFFLLREDLILSQDLKSEVKVAGVNPLDEINALVYGDVTAYLCEVSVNGQTDQITKFLSCKSHFRPPFGSPLPYNIIILFLYRDVNSFLCTW